MTEHDDQRNNTVAGEVAAALKAAGFDPQCEMKHGQTTNVMTVQPDFVDGRYRITVEREAAHGPVASNIGYVLWARGRPREGPVEPPLRPDHPAYNVKCPACGEHYGNGHKTQFLVQGPDTAEDRAKHQAGEQYPAMAIRYHALDIQGVEPDDPEPTTAVE